MGRSHLPAKNAEESAASSSAQDLEQAQLGSTESLQRGRNVEDHPQKTHLQSDLKVGEQKHELLGSACKVKPKNRRCCQLHLLEKQRSGLINWYGFHSSMFSIWYFGREVKSHSFP